MRKLTRGPFTNLDEGESFFFSQELEFVIAKTFDVVYPEYKARLFIPPSNEIHPGAETFSYTQYDRVGIAKLVKDYARDIPRADVSGKKFTAEIYSLALAFGYSIQDIRASMYAQRSLPDKKAMATVEGHEAALDRIAALGDAETGIPGFLTNPNVPVGPPPTGNWATATAQEMVGDLSEIASSIVTNTNGAERPDTILLPIDAFNRAANTYIAGTSVSALEAFLKSSPFIRSIDHWWRLDGAGVGGADRMVAYRRDSTKLELQIPQEYEVLPVQEEGLEFLVPTHSRIGGTTIYKPLSIAFRDGL